MKNEVTGKKAAAIAGKALKKLAEMSTGGIYLRCDCNEWCGKTGMHVISVADLKALAASALTQAPDRKRR